MILEIVMLCGCLSMGLDIKTIQKRLRHENAKTTMSYYLDKIQENETNVLELY